MRFPQPWGWTIQPQLEVVTNPDFQEPTRVSLVQSNALNFQVEISKTINELLFCLETSSFTYFQEHLFVQRPLPVSQPTLYKSDSSFTIILIQLFEPFSYRGKHEHTCSLHLIIRIFEAKICHSQKLKKQKTNRSCLRTPWGIEIEHFIQEILRRHFTTERCNIFRQVREEMHLERLGHIVPLSR